MQLKITFDDTATCTFEYPSEISLLEDVKMDQDNDHNQEEMQSTTTGGAPSIASNLIRGTGSAGNNKISLHLSH